MNWERVDPQLHCGVVRVSEFDAQFASFSAPNGFSDTHEVRDGANDAGHEVCNVFSSAQEFDWGSRAPPFSLLGSFNQQVDMREDPNGFEQPCEQGGPQVVSMMLEYPAEHVQRLERRARGPCAGRRCATRLPKSECPSVCARR